MGRDPFGFLIADPTDAGLSISMNDVVHAVLKAQQLGIQAPYQKKWAQLWKELKTSEWKIVWKKGADDCIAYTSNIGGKSTARSTITIPANAKPGVENCHASGTANLYFLESVILHELTHAYQQMLEYETTAGWAGPGNLGSESWPAAVSEQYEKALGGGGR